jgi:HAE1 family hydrophobic/amphiphilic exporter-1
VVITRKDRRRLITVSANLTGEKPLGAVNDELKKRVDKEVQLPKDVGIYYGGQSEFMGKNFRELFKAMGTAVVLTLLCTAGIIESFLFSGLIILSVPISVPGVVLAMLIWGDTINMFSLMAMIMVIGMLVNNAIIILDYAASPDIKHLPVLERIREACRVRFRMIVMTNLTNIAGMFPLSLGLGFAGEIFRPLAIAQIGGFIASSTLALLVIPAMYVLVEGFREKRKARKAGSSKAAGE